MITHHLNKENTRWVFTPNSSPDIWTGAGYRKGNDNNNGISFEMVKPSNSSTPFNPNSSENQVTPSGSSAKKTTTYSFLPNSISPTSDWINALTFTNKNNPQRNQLLLRALLGTIPVLINKSGTGDEFTHTSDQKWDKTNEKDGNLPGFGEVNGGFIMFLSNLYLL
ncbi:adhesin [Mycoplasmoides genitalium]